MGAIATIRDFRAHTYSTVTPILFPRAAGWAMMVGPQQLISGIGRWIRGEETAEQAFRLPPHVRDSKIEIPGLPCLEDGWSLDFLEPHDVFSIMHELIAANPELEDREDQIYHVLKDSVYGNYRERLSMLVLSEND